MRYGRDEPQQPPHEAPLRACDCPETEGQVRHNRETCTDPVAARLDWYADDQASDS